MSGSRVTVFECDDTGGALAREHAYDPAGQLTGVTLPDGATLVYEYDAAHRLTAVENGAGERIEYTLDGLGNRTQELVKSAGGQIVKTMTRTHDQLGRLLASIGAAGQTTAYAYDHNGNVVSLTDPLNGLTARAFDALDRLIAATDPLQGVTDTAYNNRDDLTGVTDPRGIETLYVHDGFGNRIQADSPDAGVTVFEYDPAGNLTRRTDGRNAVTEYAYDALNRRTARTFPASPATDIAYAHDDPTPGRFGIGRLTRITDASGATDLFYDPRGNVVRESRTVGGITADTDYAYDLADNLVEIVYPSGRIVTYARDAQGRVTGVTTQEDATAPTVPVASNIAYLPFGGIAAMEFGNGQTAAFSYDQDYRLTGIDTGDGTTPVQGLTYTHDAAGNVTAIADALDPPRGQAFAYDPLSRLTSADGAYGAITYAYDAVGNRTDRSLGAAAATYAYDAFSNRLSSVSDGAATRSLGYDVAGNTASDDDQDGSVLDFTYNDANRLVAVDVDGLPTATYTHNALGERVIKQAAGQTTHYHYDRDGRLLAETDGAGATSREYIHLAGLPLALVVPGPGGPELNTVHADNLGTPQKMTDAIGALTWDAQFRPFGESHAITGTAANDQRFPGQLLDDETGLHYNYFRDYDPTLGRYIESDPIGLAGGLNTYAYVGGNPLSASDPLGLYTEIIQWGPAPGFKGRWGHMSGNINGRNWSFGPGGWDTKYPSADQYANRQRLSDIDRGGRGMVLDLSPEEEQELEQCLASFQSFNGIANNCGNPWVQCLSQLGIINSVNQARVLPYDVFRIISRSLRAVGSTSYPGTNPPVGVTP